jgi:hypothetical protein
LLGYNLTKEQAEQAAIAMIAKIQTQPETFAQTKAEKVSAA